MNEEVEIKVIVENPEAVVAYLEKNGKYIKTKKQIDSYYITPSKDFFAENPVKEYLRIREEEGKDQTAYHFCHYDTDGKLLKTDEYESKIEDPKNMAAIFDKIGLIKKVVVNKERKYFDYKGFEVLIDHIADLGDFIEIETECEDGDFKKAKNKCFELLQELGAIWKEAPNMGYPDMILNKQNPAN